MNFSEKKDSLPVVKRIKGTVEVSNKQMLNYVNEEQLIRCVGAEHYNHLKSNLTEKLEHKPSLKSIKHEILTNVYYQKLLGQIRSSPIGSEACDKYLQAEKRARQNNRN